MTEQVISYPRPRRKRSRAWARLGALAVTAAALAVGTWLAPYVYRPPPPPIEPIKTAIAPGSIKPTHAAPKDVFTEAAEAPAPAVEARQRPRRAPRAQPTAAEAPAAQFEILSDAELDAISQARN
jgi:hypothetical protein